MATMPARSPSGQPAAEPGWFAGSAGQALLHSEDETVRTFVARGGATAWLWLGPDAGDAPAGVPGRGLRLAASASGWSGGVRCGLPLPLAGESVATIVLQHVLTRDETGRELLAECARVLVPGGRLGLLALNPLSPYRWRWRGAGLQAAEPLVWRRRLRAAGLVPDPVSQGIGPAWRETPSPQPQSGAGLRAAYLVLAEKRSLPLTPVRARRLRGAVPTALPAACAVRDRP